MNVYKIRPATIDDINFIVEAIIAAEKGGSNKLSYTSIFGLSENDTAKYLKLMLEEEIDGCELSISSYLIVECGNELAAAIGAWIEGSEDGVSSSTIKGNLLSYTLPMEAFLKAKEISHIVSELSIEYIPDSLCIGIVYVKENYRGKNLVAALLEEQIRKALHNRKKIDVYIQVFGNNIPAIKAYKKLGFKEHEIISSENDKITNYLPSNKKLLLIKENQK